MRQWQPQEDDDDDDGGDDDGNDDDNGKRPSMWLLDKHDNDSDKREGGEKKWKQH